MRDAHGIEGPKKYVESVEVAHELVKAIYPKVTREGSCGAWHWAVKEEVVAEAWIHRTRPGWWLRIKSE
jgi:hypothetical protein